MKNLLFVCLFFVAAAANAQNDSTNKKHRHELGADITGLLSQFFNMNSSQYYSMPAPVYLVTYRYYVKHSNIRFGVGGTYRKDAVSGYSINGQDQTFYNSTSQFSFRMGYEFVSELSDRWQAFYGLDFRPSVANNIQEANSSNGGYLNGTISKTTTMGMAPLLGFRFRLNNRVSLTTETSFTFNIQKQSRQITFTSLDDSLYPFRPDGPVRKTNSVFAGFTQPLFLVLTVNL